MASSVSLGPALWNDGCSYAGQAARTFDIASRYFNTGAAQVVSGVLPSGGGLVVSAGSGMSVNVAAGYFVAASSTGSTYGGYLAANTSAASGLTVATSDPSNPRIDAVYAYVTDDGTSASSAYIGVETGTPTSGATLVNLDGQPSAPSNSVKLACVLVPASSASVTSGNIADERNFTVAQGGIVPVPGAGGPAGYSGMYIHDTATGQLQHNPAAGPAQAKVLPWTWQQGTYNPGGGVYKGGTGTYITLNVTVDGNTDIDIAASCDAWSNATAGYAIIGVYISGTRVASMYSGSAGGVPSGIQLFHRTRSGTDRPAAGTHAITLLYSDSVGSNPEPTSFPGSGFVLTVSPVPL